MNSEFDCRFNLHTFYVFLVDKTSIPDNKYWMDSNCYEIDLKLKLSKKVYYYGAKNYENKNIVAFNSKNNIEIEDLSDAKKISSSLDNIKRLIKESEKVEKTVGISQEGYFLYDNSNIIKETFISEINKKVPLIGSNSYFDKVNADDKIKLITSKNRLKFEPRENSQLEYLSFQLQPTFGNKKINLRKKYIDNFSILIIPKKKLEQKRKMDEIVVNTLFVKGLQSYDKYTTLNPLDIDFRLNNLHQKLEDYKGYKYRLALVNVLFSAKFENETKYDNLP